MIQAQASMAYQSLNCSALPAEVNISRFQGASGIEEYHLVVRPTQQADIATQLEWVFDAYQRALRSVNLEHGTCVFRRFTCSDLPNQATALESHPFANPNNPDEPCAISWVCQPPLSPAKVVLSAYHVNDSNDTPTLGFTMGDVNNTPSPLAGHVLSEVEGEGRGEGNSPSQKRSDLTHMWTTGITCTDAASSYAQTRGILEKYEVTLASMGLNLRDHVIRTWFYVRDVDANYQGLVDARREFFAERGLNPDTHFIASTGIQGSSADVAAIVLTDAYAVSGVRADQIDFLSAPSYLSPPHTYGVTFERGVSVSYQDRKHVIISGTASIDRQSRIVHPGDVSKQLDHTLENIEALLKAAGATLQDVCALTTYVRDPSDIDLVQQIMCERFNPAPSLIVTAPVCRPGWLVEIECQAIVSANNPTLPRF